MTCPHCGLLVEPHQPQTEDGTRHTYCANVARGQAMRPHLTECYKHHIELDGTGWCERCRGFISG